MNKSIFLLLIALFLIPNGVTINAGPNSSKQISSLSKSYKTITYDNITDMLGVSPDGKLIAVHSLKNEDSFIQLLDSNDLTVKKEIKLSDPDYRPIAKKAVWSSDGKYIAFRKSGSHPRELMFFQGSCIYMIEIESGKLIKLSDDLYKTNPTDLMDFTLYFDPYFMPDNRSVMYHIISRDGMLMVSAAPDTKEKILYKDPVRGRFNYTIPLTDSKLLIYKYHADPKIPHQLVVYDFVRKEEKPIPEVTKRNQTENLPGLADRSIRDVSQDRRSVLIQNKLLDQNQDWKNNSLMLIRFNENFSTYSIKEIGDPSRTQIFNSAMSPNGRYVVYIKRNISDEKKIPNLFSVVLADTENNSEKIIFTAENDYPFIGAEASPMSRYNEGLFLSDSKLIIRFENSYRVYELE